MHKGMLHVLVLDQNSYLLIREEWVGLLAVLGCGWLYVSQPESREGFTSKHSVVNPIVGFIPC